jgi:hypothetical protein
LADTTFSPPIGALLPGARVSWAVIGSPVDLSSFTVSEDSFASCVCCRGIHARAILAPSATDATGKPRRSWPLSDS